MDTYGWKLCTFPGECTQTRQRAEATGDCIEEYRPLLLLLLL